jgi:hypothetical protein
MPKDEIDKAFDETLAGVQKKPLTKATIVEPSKPTVSHVEGTESFREMRRWIDTHIMPGLAWVLTVGIMVVGAMTIFSHLNQDIRVAASIFIVAFLAFKLP